MSNVVEIRGLGMRFGKKRVLEDVDLDVLPGSVTALLGRNGIGKSTLLKVLVGFHVATSGTARVLGLDLARKGPDVRRLVGYVPDRLELPKWMTVADHFRFLEPFYPTWSRDLELVLLGRLQLDSKAKVATLSKGQRAKHMLVAALAHRPQLLLLDEPFSGLDPVVRHEVLTAIMGHLKDEGRTVVLVSHSMGDVERVADRVVFLDEGRVRMDADLEDVQRRARRVGVTLVHGTESWTPPGSPDVMRSGDDVTLVYLDWDERYADLLRNDASVSDVRQLPRDLDDVFRVAVKAADVKRAAVEQPCVA
jgi:ABC-2 type transport system ATP-binding protein